MSGTVEHGRAPDAVARLALAQDHRPRAGTRDGLPAGFLVVALTLLGVGLGAALLVTNWRIICVLLAGVALIALTLRRPFSGVLVYLLIATLRPEELGLSPVVMRLQLVFAVVCLVALGLPKLLRGQLGSWRLLGTDRAMLMLTAATWASVPFSVSRGGSIGACWEFLKVVFAYALIRATATTPAGPPGRVGTHGEHSHDSTALATRLRDWPSLHRHRRRRARARYDLGGQRSKLPCQ